MYGAATCVAAMCVAASPLAAQASTEYARVAGIVFDSVAMRPLSGAVIQLVAASDPTRIRSTTTDIGGAYSIDSVSVGLYLLGAFHARFDSLGLNAPLLRVDVKAAGDVRAPMAVPSGATIVSRLCGSADVAPGQKPSLFMGFVRSARGEQLTKPAQVRVQWFEMTVNAKRIERRSPSRLTTTSESGAFAVCGIPTSGPITARAFVGADSSGYVELQPRADGLLLRDLYVGAASRVELSTLSDAPATTQPTSNGSGNGVSTSVLRGNASVRGVVRNAEGAPISGARVVLWGSGVEATTSASGAFVLTQLPAGTYTMESRAVGFTPSRMAVDALETEENLAEFTLARYVPSLDTMRVQAYTNQASNSYGSFLRRKQAGFGYFLDEDAIEKRSPVFMSDLLRTVPGVRIAMGTSGQSVVQMRGSDFSPYCTPTVLVDGMQVYSEDGNLENIASPQQVRGIEVYPRTANMPVELQRMNGCGAVVIWTGRRELPSRPR